ncbi:MAG TPA: gluconokinase [Jiangellaceae bacterium]
MPNEATEHDRPTDSMVIVVMGVSGAGKTTVGRLLATRLGLPFADADDFHPASNIALMAAGTPLTDADRKPWLHAIGRWIAAQERFGGGVVTCSALKRSYRDLLRDHCSTIFFLHLAGTRAALVGRMSKRTDHFMPGSLLDSQLADLEPLEPDEYGATLDVSSSSPERLADAAYRSLIDANQEVDT